MIVDPWGNEKAGFSVTGKIKRSDWLLNWNSLLPTGGVLVGEEVMITCDVELILVNQDNLKMNLESVEIEKELV